MKQKRFHRTLNLLRFVLWSSFFLVLPVNLLAENNGPQSFSKKPRFFVEWFLPETSESVKKNRTLVIISGRTLPHSKIEIDGRSVSLYSKKSKKIYYIKTKNIITSKKNFKKADKTGFFEWSFNLPSFLVQLPIKVTPPKRKSRTYSLALNVTKYWAKVEGKGQLRRSFALSKRRLGFWFGVGYNFLDYKQKVNTSFLSSNLEYNSSSGPSFYLDSWYRFHRDWSAELSAHSAPGAALSSNQQAVLNEKYIWWIYSLEAKYTQDHWQYQILKKAPPGQLSVRFGLQHHIVPFMTGTKKDPTAIEIQTSPLTMITVGPEYKLKFHPSWYFQTFLRYQYPINAGDLFEIKPKFAFDGSVGLSYIPKAKWRLGAAWYGQWHQYSYTSFDPGLNTKISGTQSLFFTNIEFRVGYEF